MLSSSSSKSSGVPTFSCPVDYTPPVLQSTTLLSMVDSFNTLLDSGCTRHIVRDRALFRDYVEKSVSIGTATCGSLDALGSGDVEFRYPFRDRYVIFTLRDCLYVPTAPMNLLSVGTLLDRGMSCLYSPSGITEVFFPDQHPKFPCLAFSVTVTNHLSFLLLDFIQVPPVASSQAVPVVFSARVSPSVAVGVPPSKSAKLKDSKSSGSSSRRKANPIIPKPKPLAACRPTQSYVVVDATLPSHIINDRSLFTTYTSGRKIHRTNFGHDIIIEGTGDVDIRVFVAGQYITLCLRNCWHVPLSPHHFLSCSAALFFGYQVMITSRSPRLIFPHKRRLVNPNLPKYIPFTRVNGLFVLPFNIPAQDPQPLSTTTRSAAPNVLSLPASTSFPFAGLAAFNENFLPTSQHVSESLPDSHAATHPSANLSADVLPVTSQGVAVHGGAYALVDMAVGVMPENGGAEDGGAVAALCEESEDDSNLWAETDSEARESFPLHMSTAYNRPSISNIKMLRFPSPLLSSFSLNFRQLLFTFSPRISCFLIPSLFKFSSLQLHNPLLLYYDSVVSLPFTYFDSLHTSGFSRPIMIPHPPSESSRLLPISLHTPAFSHSRVFLSACDEGTRRHSERCQLERLPSLWHHFSILSLESLPSPFRSFTGITTYTLLGIIEVLLAHNHSAVVWDTNWSPNDLIVASRGGDEKAMTWKVEGSAIPRDTVLPIDSVALPRKYTVKLWDVVNLEPEDPLFGHSGYMSAILPTPFHRILPQRCRLFQ